MDIIFAGPRQLDLMFFNSDPTFLPLQTNTNNLEDILLISFQFNLEIDLAHLGLRLKTLMASNHLYATHLGHT